MVTIDQFVWYVTCESVRKLTRLINNNTPVSRIVLLQDSEQERGVCVCARARVCLSVLVCKCVCV